MSKAKINEWCTTRRAHAMYNTFQLDNPTPLFICELVIQMSDRTVQSFRPPKGNTSKKKAENDAAELALQTLKEEIKNEYEDYAMILKSISDAIRKPTRGGNIAAVEFLIEAFELFDGWVPVTDFLIFQGVRSNVIRADALARKDNMKCLNQLNAACNAFVLNDPRINSETFDMNIVRSSIMIEKRNMQYFVRRINPVNDEEMEMLQTYIKFRLGGNNVDDYDYDDDANEDDKNEDNEMKSMGAVGTIKPESITAVILSADNSIQPREIKIPLSSKSGLLTILNGFTSHLQSLNVMSVPIFSNEFEQDTTQKLYFTTGVRIFTKVNAVGPINKIASWLAASNIIGDVLLSNVNLGILKDFTLSSLSTVISSSLPSGLWLGRNEYFSTLPTHYFHSMWPEQSRDSSSEQMKTSIASYLPYAVLQQILSRRLGSTSSAVIRKVTIQDAVKDGDKRAIAYIEKISKQEELIAVDILSRQDDEGEKLLPNPLWSKGIVHPKLTTSYNTEKVSKSIQAAITAANPVVCKIVLNFPIGSLIFGSTETITITMNVRLPNEPLSYEIALTPAEAIATCSLRALHLIQKYGENEIKGLETITPDIKLCPVIPSIKSATSVTFVMKVGEDSSTITSYSGVGMLLPNLEKILIEKTIDSTNTVTFDRDQFLPFLVPLHQSAEVTIISKNVVSCFVPASKADSFTNTRRFSPPLQEQRMHLVAAILRAVGAKSWVDLGCGSGSLILDTFNPKNKVTYVPNLKKVAAIDINPKRLHTFQSQFLQLQSEQKYASLEQIKVFEGSLCEPYSYDLLNKALDNDDETYDVISCIEVIEHLFSVEDATMVACMTLLRLRPKYAMFSTPNYEANPAIRLLPSKAIANEYMSENHNHNHEEMVNGKVPFREEDHKFEFTRAEFKEWVEMLLDLTEDSYRAEYTSIGNLLPGSDQFGGATQVVVFVRIDDNKSKPEPYLIDNDVEQNISKISWSWNP